MRERLEIAGFRSAVGWALTESKSVPDRIVLFDIRRDLGRYVEANRAREFLDGRYLTMDDFNQEVTALMRQVRWICKNGNSETTREKAMGLMVEMANPGVVASHWRKSMEYWGVTKSGSPVAAAENLVRSRLERSRGTGDFFQDIDLKMHPSPYAIASIEAIFLNGLRFFVGPDLAQGWQEKYWAIVNNWRIAEDKFIIYLSGGGAYNLATDCQHRKIVEARNELEKVMKRTVFTNPKSDGRK